MGSPTNKSRPFGAGGHTPCTRTHQIGALLLVAATFFLSRVFDRPCDGFPSADLNLPLRSELPSSHGGDFSWPQRGYGPHLDLKIYVYDENEIEGLKALMYGRDGEISAVKCMKGQWGTQAVDFRSLWCVRYFSFPLFEGEIKCSAWL